MENENSPQDMCTLGTLLPQQLHTSSSSAILTHPQATRVSGPLHPGKQVCDIMPMGSFHGTGEQIQEVQGEVEGNEGVKSLVTDSIAVKREAVSSLGCSSRHPSETCS
ncbi:hypothetical protein DPEC_G00035410 [Dallia pectoralis]|uniref:Uncharacterized protein n=1 Tax=Dallia pectoralis TaxID=75939 RepID=A0ACC2HER2_DALPE|nr:hypothetical protein DPEC_G00035410 [Dallia pectoralis]